MKVLSTVEMDHTLGVWTCDYCHSDLEICGNDMQYDDYEEEYFVNCQVCDRKIVLDCSEIPTRILDTVSGNDSRGDDE